MQTSTTIILSPVDVHGMWFPTVRKTVLCLTKLYRCLDKDTFQNMSQDVVVGASIVSLDEAADRISVRKTNLDSFLFLIKHLLIVREQVSPFNIQCIIREVNLDFDRVTNAAISLILGSRRESNNGGGGNTLNMNLFSLTANNAPLRLFLDDKSSSLTVIEEIFDAKKVCWIPK